MEDVLLWNDHWLDLVGSRKCSHDLKGCWAARSGRNRAAEEGSRFLFSRLNMERRRVFSSGRNIPIQHVEC